MDGAASIGTMHATLIGALRASFHMHERASSADCSASAAAFVSGKHAQASFPRERAATAPLRLCPVGNPHSPGMWDVAVRFPFAHIKNLMFTFAHAGHVNRRVELDLRCNVLFDKGRVVRRVFKRVVVVLLGNYFHRFFEALF